MDLRNCPECGKLFAYDGQSKLCPVCRDKEENKFKIVKDYLWDHPNATIEQVHEDTEVERELIIKFVKDRRLISEGLELDLVLECERCGTPITEGRFCNKCQQELLQGFKPTKNNKKKKEKKKKRSNDRMHIADRLRKEKDK